MAGNSNPEYKKLHTRVLKYFHFGEGTVPILAQTLDGLFHSPDGGQHWENMQSRLHGVARLRNTSLYKVQPVGPDTVIVACPDQAICWYSRIKDSLDISEGLPKSKHPFAISFTGGPNPKQWMAFRSELYVRDGPIQK